MKELSFKTKFFNGLRIFFRNRIAERLLYPLTSGSKWNGALAKIPANYYQYKKGSFRNVTRNGFQFQLDISDYMQWLIYFGVLAEPREVLYKLIKPGMTVLDVGANIGETTLAFSKLCGKNGKVFSFEPDPGTFAKLKKHLELNHCENVLAINKGLGKTSGEVFFEAGVNNSGGNRVSPKQQSGSKKISISSLDQAIEELNITKIDFIKIDVEGYEYLVLEGSEKTIQRFRPTFFIELVDDFLKEQGSSAEMLVTFLSEKKYSITNANDGSLVTPKLNFSGSHFDIIASPVCV